jgi:flagellar FliL protein
MKKLLPLILLLVGSGAGVGAGIFLRPEPPQLTEEEKMEIEEAKVAEKIEKEEGEGEASDKEYVKLSNQFVVPIVNDNFVSALVVLSLSIEVEIGQKDSIFAREPKLRDAILQVLFDHANMGGFEGEFTSASNLKTLRTALREVAQKEMGEGVSDVLILEIARQDY